MSTKKFLAGDNLVSSTFCVNRQFPPGLFVAFALTIFVSPQVEGTYYIIRYVYVYVYIQYAKNLGCSKKLIFYSTH